MKPLGQYSFSVSFRLAMIHQVEPLLDRHGKSADEKAALETMT